MVRLVNEAAAETEMLAGFSQNLPDKLIALLGRAEQFKESDEKLMVGFAVYRHSGHI